MLLDELCHRVSDACGGDYLLPGNEEFIAREVSEYVDEIETEIKRNYMRLPVDADGVPIQIGDLLESSEINKHFMCRGMSLALQSNEKWWTVEWSYDHYYGTSEYVSAKSCRHVKPRTIEDVLRDMLDAYDGGEHYELPYSFIANYADELRGMMEVGGGAE